jgi:DNA recombination-dependent growth factor C
MSKTILDSATKATVFFYREADKIDWHQLDKMGYNPTQSLSADLTRMGLVHPLANLGLAPEDTVLETFDGGYLTALRIDKSVVTVAAIRQAANAEIASRLEELGEDEDLGRDERAAILAAMHAKLVEVAPEVSKYVPVLIDTDSKRIIILETTPKVTNAVTIRINNMFAGNIEVIPWASLATKADITSIGATIQSKLQLFVTEDDAQEALFETCSNLSFGTGVKLTRLDDHQGNDVTLPQFDLGDTAMQGFVERAHYVDHLGLYLTHGTSDIEFQINQKLQFKKLGLGMTIDANLSEDDVIDVTAEIRATSILMKDSLLQMVNNVSNFLGILPELD